MNYAAREGKVKESVGKIYARYGKEQFTVKELKEDVLPDLTSGEIKKWNMSGIVEYVGKTVRTRAHNSVGIWKLCDSVIKVLDGHDDGTRV